MSTERRRAAIDAALKIIRPIVRHWIRRHPGVPDGRIQIAEMLMEVRRTPDADRLRVAVLDLRSEALFVDGADVEGVVAAALKAAELAEQPA